MKVQFVSFTLGYVEESSIASLVFARPGGPIELEEGLKELAEDIYAFYSDECVSPFKDCCVSAGNVKFCPECGNSNPGESSDNYWDFRKFLWHLLSYSSDQYGGAYDMVGLPNGSMHEMRWHYANVADMVQAPNENCLCFEESSEDVLILLNHKYHPERFEDYEEKHWLNLDEAIDEAKI